MSGLCGWLDETVEAAGTASALDGMVRVLAERGGDEPERLVCTPGAVAAGPGARAARVDDCLVAWDGRPRWTRSEPAGTAGERGFAAALVAGYRREGERVLERLRGPFTVALVEPARKEALLAVDRFGIGRLAFASSGAGLAFASRLDALARHPRAERRLDPQALFAYLYFHVVPAPLCIHAGMEKLLPGECVRFKDGRIERHRYFSPRYLEAADRDEARLAGELREVLAASIEGAVDGLPTGTFLSGGLDSSTVTGLLARRSQGPVDAYAIGFAAEGYDEMGYARASAKHFGARLHEHYVTPEEVVEAIPLVARAYDEPFGNASAVPTYYCARTASADGKRVLLAGDGGDEIFAGNARYAKQQVFELYRRLPKPLRTLALEPLVLGLPAANGFTPWRKLRSYVEQARTPLPDRLESYNFLHREPLEGILHPDLLAAIDREAPLRALRTVYGEPDTPSALKRMLHLDLKFTLADNDLRKVSRMCEVAGVEVRYPMLDERLVELAARVPSRFLLRRGELRAFYKRALRDFLAPETIAKTKHGFGLPFGLWLREHRGLRELAGDSLEALKKRRYVRADYIDRVLTQHRDGHAVYYGVMVWILLALEQWLERHS